MKMRTTGGLIGKFETRNHAP